MTVEISAGRIGTALRVARSLEVPMFVVNARCDAWLVGKDIEEVISRGEMYLKASATCVSPWGGPK